MINKGKIFNVKNMFWIIYIFIFIMMLFFLISDKRAVEKEYASTNFPNTDKSDTSELVPSELDTGEPDTDKSDTTITPKKEITFI